MTVRRMLLISGAIHAGKSTLAGQLQGKYGFSRISSRKYLATFLPTDIKADSEAARELLQEIGDRLDRETDYRWLVDPVAEEQIADARGTENWLVDAVRKARQVEHFRSTFPRVLHVHFTAPEAVLIARHAESADHYAKRIAHPNEVSARSLGLIADQTFDTTQTAPAEICDRVMALWEK
jgi:adenylate kinase family enzyme